MSGSNLFYLLMTSGMKEFLKYSDLQETILNELTCQQKLLIDGSERMADQLKKFYRVSTIFYSIFFNKGIPVLIPITVFHKKNL